MGADPVGGALELHRLGRVEEDRRREVGLLFVFLDVEPVAAAVDLPVDVLGVVAGHVLAVLGELDREAVVGAGVHARDVALDQEPGLEVEPLEAS